MPMRWACNIDIIPGPGARTRQNRTPMYSSSNKYDFELPVKEAVQHMFVMGKIYMYDTAANHSGKPGSQKTNKPILLYLYSVQGQNTAFAALLLYVELSRKQKKQRHPYTAAAAV